MGWSYEICRICLEESEMLLHLFRTKLNEKLESISSVIKLRGIRINDGLPTVICEPCAKKLDAFYEFKIQCESSDSILRLQKYAKDPLGASHKQLSNSDSAKGVNREGSASEESDSTALKTESMQVLGSSIKEEFLSAELRITESSDLKEKMQQEARVTLEKQKSAPSPYNCKACGKPLSSRHSLRRHQKLHFALTQSKGNDIHLKNYPSLQDDFMTTHSEDQNSENEPGNVIEAEGTSQIESGCALDDLSESISITNCPMCSEAVHGLKGYKEHACSHKADYPCTLCGKTSLNKMHFKKHSIGMLVQKLNQCEFCGRDFQTQMELKFHIPVHGNLKKQVCSLCNKLFPSLFKLESHVLNHHKIEDGIKLFMCEKCGKKFRTNYLLQSHLNIHSGVKPHSCTYCGKSFSNKSNMLVHTRIHRGEKPYACEFCGKTFTQSSELKVHAVTHSEERPFECNICNKRFRIKSHYRSHVQIHGGAKTFSCDLCGTAFRHRRTLKTHMLRHTGEKPYPCKVCGKCFTKSSNLKTHNLIHTGEKPHECKVCGQTFRVAVSLRNHISRYHKDTFNNRVGD